MAKVLSGISLDSPAAPVSASVNDTFAFSGTPSFSGGGGVQRYDFKWEVDDGGGFVTIGASGTGLITAGTNPVINTNSQAQQSITVTCDQAGSYTIRMAGAPTSGGSYTVLSATQTVTVSAAAITGTGALAAQAADVTGTGTSESSGTGALSAQAAAVSGVGTAGDPSITGTGALVAGAAVVDGAGLSLSTGSGNLAAQAAAVDGAGVSASEGTGTIAAQASAVDGTGVSESTGTGALQASDSTITGSEGLAAITGSGDLVSSAASISSVGEVSDGVPAYEGPVEGAGIRFMRRQRHRPDLPKLHPEEIARQQREDERYLASLEKNPEQRGRAGVAESQAPVTSEPGDAGVAPGRRPAVPEPILADLAARAASAVQAKVEKAEAAAITLAKQERRQRALVLLALL